MSGLNIRKFLNNFSNNYGSNKPSAAGTSANSANNVQSEVNRVQMDTSAPKLPSDNALSHLGQNIKNVAQTFKLNVLQNVDRASYIKEALNIPKNMNEFIYMVQQNLTKNQLTKFLATQQPSTQQTVTTQKTISNIESQLLSQQAYIKNSNIERNLTVQNLIQQPQNTQLQKPANNNQNQAVPQQTYIQDVNAQKTFTLQNLTQQSSQSNQLSQNQTTNTSQTSGQVLANTQSAKEILLSQQVQNSTNKNTLKNVQNKILAEISEPQTEIELEDSVEINLSKELQATLKKLNINSGGMINLGKISQLIQQNGKSAITKIIMSMTEASKSGITDLSQMKDLARIINASISIAAENNPQKTLKLFMLLYLPWLPLSEGVTFDIEIEEKQSSENCESDSILVISVTTVNFGTVRATLVLETSNSVQVSIECAEKFPKKELKLRIDKEQTYYSMDSLINFNTDENIKQSDNAKQSASVNMSQTTEVNPFLLLMAHALIKHIIDIDNNKTLGLTSHEDKL